MKATSKKEVRIGKCTLSDVGIVRMPLTGKRRRLQQTVTTSPMAILCLVVRGCRCRGGRASPSRLSVDSRGHLKYINPLHVFIPRVKVSVSLRLEARKKTSKWFEARETENQS